MAHAVREQIEVDGCRMTGRDEGGKRRIPTRRIPGRCTPREISARSIGHVWPSGIVGKDSLIR